MKKPPMMQRPQGNAPSSEEVRALEARRRLRAARQEANLTPEALAARIGRASSTVRAHENGQNKITAEAADMYAGALGVSPSWILWGETDAPATDFPQERRPEASGQWAPIVGEIRGEKPSPDYNGSNAKVFIPILDYEAFPLRAFRFGMSAERYVRGDYVVTAPLEVGCRDGDQIVVTNRRGDGLYHSIHAVAWNSAGIFLQSLSPDVRELAVIDLPPGVIARQPKRGEVWVEGVVVAYGGHGRPITGRIVQPDRLKRLDWSN